MNRRKNLRKNSDNENPDITSPLSSTLPAEPNTKATGGSITDKKIIRLPPDDPGVVFDPANKVNKKQEPDLSASTDLARRNSENRRPLIELANIKSMKKYGYCRVGASYNYAYSIHHNNKLLGVNTLYLVTTILFVILKMSDVYLQNLLQTSYRHQYSSDVVVLAVCQTIPKSNNKLMSAGQINKTLNCRHGTESTDCLPSHVNHSRCVYSEKKEEVHCISSQSLAPTYYLKKA